MTATRDALDIVPFRIAVGTDLDDGESIGTLSDACIDQNDIYGKTRHVIWSWPGRSAGINVPASSLLTTFATAVAKVPAGQTACTLYAQAVGTVTSSVLRVSGTSGGPDDLALVNGYASMSVTFATGPFAQLIFSVSNGGGADFLLNKVWIVADTL